MLISTKRMLVSLALIAILSGHNLAASEEVQYILPELLLKRLQERQNSLGPEYQPRTIHLTPSGEPKYTNRLYFESSPYLLQHAHNPVNWYSWSQEAFTTAQEQNKPIFLSIGYSTCHWCHVMEEESFENPLIAGFLNRHFISIKVDREQLPDIDHTYMLAASMLSGQTGWPLNAFLTPEGAPFYAATYFPPTQFHELISEVSQLWQQQPEKLIKSGSDVLTAIQQISSAKQNAKHPTAKLSEKAAHEWLKIADELQGGFGIAPKFPNEPTLLFLLQHSIQHQDQNLLNHLKNTLDAMQQGGIFDQIGGGFHRYTIDPGWLIPHFEKMLYNQAQMLQVYLLAYQVTGDPSYRRTIEKTLYYLETEMRSEAGLFYSATDADSEGEEGKYFLWELSQLEQTLTPEEITLAKPFYGFDKGTNFDGKNILFLPQSISEFFIGKGLKVEEFFSALETLNKKLLQARMQRIPPHKDDKIITAWNSMMIVSLVKASQTLKEPHHLTAAKQTAESLWVKHYLPQGYLLRDTREELPGKKASLEDYAHFGLANLTLYDVTDDPKWLDRSLDLVEEMLALFWDEATSSFFISRQDTLLPLRAKDRGDRATPAATSVAYEFLSKLGRRQPDQRFTLLAQRLITSLSANLSVSPMQYSYLLKAFDEPATGINTTQFGAHGALKATLSKVRNDYLLSIKLKPGWHINAHSPGHSKLVATQLSANWIKSVKYPQHLDKQVSFMQGPIRLYGNQSSFTITPTETKNNLDQLLKFSYQACNDKQCLPPEVLFFSSDIQ